MIFFSVVKGQHPSKSAHPCAKQDQHIHSLLTAESYRLWVVVERNLWERWRLYMWQNILVWQCWTCSMWYLGCCSEIMWWKLTVDFVIKKTAPNSHTCSTQWLADKLQLLFWLTLHSLSIMEKLSPYVVLQVSDSTDFSQIALLKAYFVPFLPSTVCLSLLNRYIHPTSLQNHSLSALCGLGRKMG